MGDQEAIFLVAPGEKAITPDRLFNKESSHGAETRESIRIRALRRHL